MREVEFDLGRWQLIWWGWRRPYLTRTRQYPTDWKVPFFYCWNVGPFEIRHHARRGASCP